MIKVVQVVSDTNIGGAGRYLLNYLKYFDRSKFEVYVVVPNGSMLVPHIKTHVDVNLVEAPFMADKSYDKRCVKFLKKLFSEISPQIIHTHASLSARIAARHNKTAKIVSTRHCLEPVETGLKAKLKGMVNSNLTDVYIAVADAVKENLEKCFIPKEKIKTVYNGVEKIDELSEDKIKEVRKSLNIEDDEIAFGIFARLESVKGHKYFLKAARELLKTGRKAKFVVVGEGSLEDDLKKRVEKYDIKDNVIFTGFVEDTSELLNAVDINVNSSESEAMSLSILEAMSLGKPTIATDVGGNSQLVKSAHTGLLVAANDTTSLSEAMIQFVDDNKLYEVCAKGALGEYKEKFSADIMVLNLEKLYLEII